MSIDRHKVFISYYHRDDQFYKDEIIKMREWNYEKGQFQSIFEDYSVHENEIDDTGLTPEQIRRIIRDDYIRDATVLVLLCGANTKRRKFIDWELQAAMYDSEINPKMGIVVVNLPSIQNIQWVRASNEDEKRFISNNANWYSFHSREEYEENYPFMPSRIIDNFVKGVPITVVNWNVIYGNKQIFKYLIDNAFKRKDSIVYNNFAPLRSNNS